MTTMNMIQGFHIDITAAEMVIHLHERAAHHTERASFYEAQREQFKDAPTAQMSGDPVKGLAEAGQRHAALAERFVFYAKHVPPESTFRMTTSELRELEFIQGAVW